MVYLRAQACACLLRSKCHWIQWELLPGKYLYNWSLRQVNTSMYVISLVLCAKLRHWKGRENVWVGSNSPVQKGIRGLGTTGLGLGQNVQSKSKWCEGQEDGDFGYNGAFCKERNRLKNVGVRRRKMWVMTSYATKWENNGVNGGNLQFAISDS